MRMTTTAIITYEAKDNGFGIGKDSVVLLVTLAYVTLAEVEFGILLF